MRCLCQTILLVVFASIVATVHAGPDYTTSIPVGPGTTIYVRYGEPGGVRIFRGRTATVDSDTTQGLIPGDAAARAAWMERFRLLLRDEIASQSAAERNAPSRRPGIILDDNPSINAMERPAQVVVVAPSPRPTPQRPPDSAAVGGPAGISERAPVADPRVEPPPAPGAGPESPANNEPRSVPPTREVIRAAFMDAGLLESNLILFETGRDEILPPSMEFLRSVAAVLAEFPDARLRVEGHTDDVGSAEKNLELSTRRAEAVRAFLVAAGGTAENRVEAAGYGEASPLVPNESVATRALNRRVVIRVLNPESLAH